MPEFNPGGAADLNQAVKLRYEANPDTNAFSDAEKGKLAGIAPGATANAADAALRDRASHTGTQSAATITDFDAAVAAAPAVAANSAKETNATHTGDVTGAQALTIAAGAVTNAKLAAMPAATLKGRPGAGAGAPEDLSGAQATALLDLFTDAAKGLAPASGGGTAAFLRADGAWAVPPAGGGTGTVTGPAASVDNALPRFDGTTGTVLEGSAVRLTDQGELVLPVVAVPTTPDADSGAVFARRIGNRMMLSQVGPSGLDSTLQPFLGRNKVGYWQPSGNSTTAVTQFGIAMTSAGTAVARNVATTNAFTRIRRIGYSTGTTAGSAAGLRHSALQFSVGDGAGQGGFFMVIRFGFSALTPDARAFVGMRNSTAAPPNVNPATLTQCLGVGRIDGASSLHILRGGSSAQAPVDLGPNFPANTIDADIYELTLFSPPTVAETVHYEVTRLNTGHVATGTLTGNATALPSATTLLAGTNSFVSNNATAAAAVIDWMSFYIETDN